MTSTDSTSTDRRLRVVRLEIENFMRVRGVDITPEGDVVVVAGGNGEGKSSILNAIWAALVNSAAGKGIPAPIRSGATTARVRLDLGEIVVTRRWTESGTTLKVESAEGASYRSPQAMLDKLVGSLAFDPLAFTRQREKEQVETLLGLLDLPVDPQDLDARRGELFAERTDVNRQVKALEGQLAGLPEDPDAPAEVVSLADAMQRVADAEAEVAEWRAHQDLVSRLQVRADGLRAEIARLQEELAAAVAEHSSLVWEGPSEDGLPDIGVLRMEAVNLESRNERARAALARNRVAEDLAAARAESARLTQDIGCLDETKATLLAEADMPLPGLGFDDTGVTYRGVPLRQCSAAEQLRVSVSIAMAMNPTVRVIRVTDGSLLDSESMRILEDMARDQGFQVWCEVVRDPGTGGVGFVIEDGQVAQC